jgi:diguanylate cyclase (GGDEF)-like protein
MNSIDFLASHHDPKVVAASVCIATLASYVTLDLSLRVRAPSGEVNEMWWLAGSLVMGTGIWAMHFVGMLAYSLPIPLGFTGWLTGLSWIAAVLASALALRVSSSGRHGLRAIAPAAVVMGLGIAGMHYIGMAALDLTVPIVWKPGIVALSVAIAVGTSAVALVIFRYLLQVSAHRRFMTQCAAAVVMGAAICGMHYTGMAAAQFPAGTVCMSANALGGTGLTSILVVATAMLLVGALLASMLDARLQVVARRLTHSLQEANVKLETANEELTQRAFSDSLTGLPNRRVFQERLSQAVQRLGRPDAHSDAHRDARQLAVLFIDLDGFKPVNDSFGHAAGDEVLKVTAARLSAAVREGDTVARIGGDEFLVLLDELDSAAACEPVIQRILEAISAPQHISGHEIQVTGSIGAALMDAGGDGDRLIASADAAMYVAKRVGGARFVFFEEHMAADATRQLKLQSDLRSALDQAQFELYYQPKIDARRNRISGVEALLRWNHPKRGIVPPNEFIPLAERSGLIVSLGRWVLDEACRQIAAWRSEGCDLRVAVNFSTVQLCEPSLVGDVGAALKRHGVPASQLLCEVTESVLMQDMDTTMRVFDGLRALGVQLSIDDFGTGYSSLSQLKNLPARQLKIDRSFIQELEQKDDARAVVEAVIKLAHTLRLKVVAEGVETAGQRDILVRLGCDELQGYLYARPMQAHLMRHWSLDAPLAQSRTLLAALAPDPDTARAS